MTFKLPLFLVNHPPLLNAYGNSFYFENFINKHKGLVSLEMAQTFLHNSKEKPSLWSNPGMSQPRRLSYLVVPMGLSLSHVCIGTFPFHIEHQGLTTSNFLPIASFVKFSSCTLLAVGLF